MPLLTRLIQNGKKILRETYFGQIINTFESQYFFLLNLPNLSDKKQSTGDTHIFDFFCLNKYEIKLYFNWIETNA